MLALLHHPVVGLAGIGGEQFLRHAQHGRRVLGDLGGEFHRIGEQRVRLCQAVSELYPHGFLA